MDFYILTENCHSLNIYEEIDDSNETLTENNVIKIGIQVMNYIS